TIMFCIISILIHESALLSTVLTVLLLYYIKYASCAFDKKAMTLSILTYVACTAIVLSISPNSSEAAGKLYQDISTRVDWPLSQETFKVLVRTTRDNIIYTISEYFDANGIRPGGWRILFSLVVVFPSMIFLSSQILTSINRKIVLP